MFGVTGSSRACADNVINPAVHDIVSLEVVCTPGFHAWLETPCYRHRWLSRCAELFGLNINR